MGENELPSYPQQAQIDGIESSTSNAMMGGRKAQAKSLVFL